jgi:hypothetical protein
MFRLTCSFSRLLHITRGISGSHCVRLGYAKFSPPLRYGEIFLCLGNVVGSKRAIEQEDL